MNVQEIIDGLKNSSKKQMKQPVYVYTNDGTRLSLGGLIVQGDTIVCEVFEFMTAMRVSEVIEQLEFFNSDSVVYYNGSEVKSLTNSDELIDLNIN